MELKKLVDAAVELMAKHGLVEWKFGIADSKRRLGVCKYDQKQIEIGEFYARNNPEESVLDTLLHEIAHALAGPEAGHGPVWRAIAIRIGATPKACDNSPETIVEPGDWQTTCPACHRTHHRYRRPKTLDGYRCRCPARSPLVFQYQGDPACEPPPPRPRRVLAVWQATCAGCGVVHRRMRRPKAGVWRCRCPHHGELTWQYFVMKADVT